MGQSQSLRCLVESGVVSGSDVERLMRKYRTDVENKLIDRRRALELCDDLEPYFEFNQWGPLCDVRDTRKWVETQPEDKVSFSALFQKLTVSRMESRAMDLTDSAKEHVYGIRETPHEKEIREHGKPIAFAGAREYRGDRLEWDIAQTRQESLATHLPRDVLILIMCSLQLVDIARCAASCRRWYLGARLILDRARPPHIYLDPNMQDPSRVAWPYSSIARQNASQGKYGKAIERIFVPTDGEEAGILWVTADGSLMREETRGGEVIVLPSVKRKTGGQLEVLDFGRDGIIIFHRQLTLKDQFLAVYRLLGLKLEFLGELSLSLGASEAGFHMHADASGNKFAFCIQGSASVLEIRMMAAVPDDPGVLGVLNLQHTSQKLVFWSRATQKRSSGCERGRLVEAKNHLLEPLVWISGSQDLPEFYSHAKLYHPETRHWQDRPCSGHFPTQESAIMMFPTCLNGRLLLMNRMNNHMSGFVYSLDWKLGSFTHVSLGSLRTLPFHATGGVTVAAPGCLVFWNHLCQENSVQAMFLQGLPAGYLHVKSKDAKRLMLIESKATKQDSFILSQLSKLLLESLREHE